MKYICNLLAFKSLLLFALTSQIASATTLYNGSGFPELQGWLQPGAIDSDGNPLVSFPATPVSGGITIQTNGLDSSSPTAGYLGYSNYTPNLFDLSKLELVNSSFPSLNASDGYSIFFDLAVNSLPESDDNRAAFSLIVISSDVTSGIELDFESDLIFAQSDTINRTGFSEFLRAETSSTFDTTVSNSYELRVNNSQYELFANGNPSSLLSGVLRDYEFNINATEPNLPFNPYETANFLFFGDLTDRAAGTFTLGEVRLESRAIASTPESTPTLVLALLGFGFGVSKLYSRNKVAITKDVMKHYSNLQSSK